MEIFKVKRSILLVALVAIFIAPTAPQIAFAQEKPVRFPLDLNPDATPKDDSGLTPSSPIITNSANSITNKLTPRPQSLTSPGTAKYTMNAARLPEAYACPLFENRPHTELIQAIDSLTKEVKISSECTGSPSAKSLEENGNAIKENVINLEKMLQLQNPTDLSLKQIDQSVTAAITAAGNVGDIINNNDFLNSKCGRQTMSSGKILLAINDVVNGLAPYALIAVSMNAAMAPALPYVVGSVVATSGIAAVSKMIDQNTLDMRIPEHRKAVLLNTCQYTKVAKKVQFMQLAQSGKIESITNELEHSIDLYKIHFGQPTKELTSLLSYRDGAYKKIQSVEAQLFADRNYMQSVDGQLNSSSDDFMFCSLSFELMNAAQDGRSFPSSVFLNLSRIAEQGNHTSKIEAATMKSMHLNLMRKIAASAPTAYQNENDLKACSAAGRSWISSIRQALANTVTVTDAAKAQLESELSKNEGYRQWKIQYNKIEEQKVTIKRVERAMEELGKDTSIIDRSELAQRMMNLKAGLFGSRTSWGFGTPPVLAWIEHTKQMHDESISSFKEATDAIHNASYKMTEAGQGKAVHFLTSGTMYLDELKLQVSKKIAKNLLNVTIQELPPGSRENELVCQQLQNSWLEWSAAIDHLGAIQFFCDMIDPVLDVRMDTAVVKSCRGTSLLNGKEVEHSLVDNAKATLISKGFRDEANLVSKKLKELQCPMPTVTVMTN